VLSSGEPVSETLRQRPDPEQGSDNRVAQQVNAKSCPVAGLRPSQKDAGVHHREVVARQELVD
jgi:hypothetical protein